jgi:hypothetical protein
MVDKRLVVLLIDTTLRDYSDITGNPCPSGRKPTESEVPYPIESRDSISAIVRQVGP